MGRTSNCQRLATQFTQQRLSTPDGAIFVPPQPVDLEHCFVFDPGGEIDDDPTLSAFECLLEKRQYRLALSLSWRCHTAYHTLDLGLLRLDNDLLFAVHQLNDDAGTSLLVASLASTAPQRIFHLFLIDYLSTHGSAYAVSLPTSLPQIIWIADPELAPQAVVAAGLFGLVAPDRAAPAVRQVFGDMTYLGQRSEGEPLFLA
ncbi:MAG: hypothetical protein RMK84_06275 [Oscillochloridaceae bacterium]|nr:hypothetical protein [Chloroflexaceae bacterium]MDW8389713.1 hypothetical protein [Oscillochloridaceae bacterium]